MKLTVRQRTMALTLSLASTLLLLAGCRAATHADAGAWVHTDPLTLRGSQFLAVSVADLERSRVWYAQTFALQPTLEIISPDSSVRTTVLASPSLIVELSAHRAARPLREYAGQAMPTFLVHGFFKGGLMVANLDSAIAVLQRRAAGTLTSIRADTASALRFVFLRDPDGNFLQMLERDWRP